MFEYSCRPAPHRYPPAPCSRRPLVCDGEHNSQQVLPRTVPERVVTRLLPYDGIDPGPVGHSRRCKRLDLLRNEGV